MEYINLTVMVRKDDETDEYVARCEELGISSSGLSVDDAFAMVADAVELYLDALEAEGERDRVFAECGITILQEKPRETELRATFRLRDVISRIVVPVSAAWVPCHGEGRR